MKKSEFLETLQYAGWESTDYNGVYLTFVDCFEEEWTCQVDYFYDEDESLGEDEYFEAYANSLFEDEENLDSFEHKYFDSETCTFKTETISDLEFEGEL